MSEEALRAKLGVVCSAKHLVMGEAWVQKVLQLKQVQELPTDLLACLVGWLFACCARGQLHRPRRGP